MTRPGKTRSLRDSIEAAIPFLFPALGGLFGVVWVNLHKLDQLNPMYWIGGGILLGFIVARVASNLLSKFR